jgi:hypothetical protein
MPLFLRLFDVDELDWEFRLFVVEALLLLLESEKSFAMT